MVYTSKIILSVLTFGFIFLGFACDNNPSQVKKKPLPNVVSGEISSPVPVVQTKSSIDAKKDEPSPKNTVTPEIDTDVKNNDLVSDRRVMIEKRKHYDAKGKIDPFRPLIQEKPVETTPTVPVPVVDPGPKRILTPLEKIELSQIRLVAVILMKKKQIAMVEDAKGKGYEVGIGTYIGKNEGRVSEIKSSSIIIKEIVKDYKGRLKENIQEIKLHKNEE